ncbi:hypothetical protein M2459_000098 [Parabacteroides sp. PF5-5]|uniref:hypothetical protein n=1 Tax=unclassified Parabacteroides TaxID=2649774 RepID=UPI0024769A58|nr:MULTISPECIES: hypothetical protein [unclassified Parabacteroides]MDH6303766.1 hypothetical protein [Parabacteroides sp. PH5-39]MDH6314383.1 hypothetical protein [Parabacteroides sp. PF5-13]MDH6318552.1 hypothetical protein [Parabacteroides sp. PH5-13]MDH6322155.1 hypothetical protein [Parabacteroides sp. PH5-8]MDH6325765.1 hypothetical protein [Parabacteroides sp. PH5-41]
MKKYVFSLLMIGLFFSCDNSSKDPDTPCTEEFCFYTVKVQDTNGNPVVLDSIKVVLDDKDITPQKTQTAYEPGMYEITNDNYQTLLVGEKKELIISGYIDGEAVFNDGFLFGADRCHVSYSGEKPLVVTLRGDDDIQCTEVLFSFGVKVYYEDESPVILDSIKVLWKDTDITPSKYMQEDFQRIGTYFYALTSDGLTKLFGATGNETVSDYITFFGYIKDKEVIKEDFLFSTDKCHAYYNDEKPLTIILKK